MYFTLFAILAHYYTSIACMEEHKVGFKLLRHAFRFNRYFKFYCFFFIKRK